MTEVQLRALRSQIDARALREGGAWEQEAVVLAFATHERQPARHDFENMKRRAFHWGRAFAGAARRNETTAEGRAACTRYAQQYKEMAFFLRDALREVGDAA